MGSQGGRPLARGKAGRVEARQGNFIKNQTFEPVFEGQIKISHTEKTRGKHGQARGCVSSPVVSASLLPSPSPAPSLWSAFCRQFLSSKTI